MGNMNFETVEILAGAVSSGKIILLNWDKNNQPIWAEVLSNKVAGDGLYKEVLTIRYRLLSNGVVAEDNFHEGESVTVRV